MAEQLFANVASTTLAASITSATAGATDTWTVVSSANFPAANAVLDQQFRAALVDTATPPNILEYIAVTQVTGTTWTVTRAVEEPTRFPASARASGTRIVMVVTRGVLESFERRTRTVGSNVLDYGAVGNSSHSPAGSMGNDDTTAINNAQVDAQAASGLVLYPSPRTFGITSTILPAPDPSKSPNWQVGMGAAAYGQVVLLPNLAWYGASGGTMMNTQASGGNIVGALTRALRFAGRDLANTGLRLGPTSTNAAKLDTGTGLDYVVFAGMLGDAVRIEGLGATNWWCRDGRWDRIQGYGIYTRVASQTFMAFEHLTWDAIDVTSHGVDFAKGFLHLDASEGTDTGLARVAFRSFHPESGGLKVTNASGTNPADQRGIIACTAALACKRVQFDFELSHIQCLGFDSLDASHSLIQMLGGSDTEANNEIMRSPRLSVNGRIMDGFGGDGTAALGQLIPIGGIPTGHKQTNGNFNSFIHAPSTGSDVFGSERRKISSYTA